MKNSGLISQLKSAFGGSKKMFTEKTIPMMMMIMWVMDGCVMWHIGDVNQIPNFIGQKAFNKQKMT